MIPEAVVYIATRESRPGRPRRKETVVTSVNPAQYFWGSESDIKDIVGIDALCGDIRVLRKNYEVNTNTSTEEAK